MDFFTKNIIYNAMKDPHRYAVQGSDTTMLKMAAFCWCKKN